MTKVRITGIPSRPKTGDQINGELYTNQWYYRPNNEIPTETEYNTTEPIVPEEDATIEAERGEYTIGSELNSLLKIGGKPHAQGGTNIAPDPGSYIVSNHIKVDPDVADTLGLKGYKPTDTWAKFLGKNIEPEYFNRQADNMLKIAKGKYINQFERNLVNAQFQDLQTYLSKIALGNELTKMKQGDQTAEIPNVGKLALEEFIREHGGEKQSTQNKKQPKQESEQNEEQSVEDNEQTIPYNEEYAQDGKQINPYTSSRTKKGGITPTGLSNYYDRDANYLDDWNKVIPNIRNMSNSDAQTAIYDYTLQHNPNLISQMWNKYGLTQKGKDVGLTNLFNANKGNSFSEDVLTQLKPAYVDGLFGARQLPYIPNNQDINKTPRIPIENIPNNGIPTTLTGEPSKVNLPYIEQPGLTNKDENEGKDVPFSRDYFLGDVLSMGQALSQRPKYYPPWLRHMEPAYINPMFDNPNYNPIIAQQVVNNDYINQFADPNTARANMSYQPSLTQGLIQETQRSRGNNLQQANQSQMYNNQMYNRANEYNNNIDNQLYQQSVVAKENYDTQNAMYRQNFLNVFNNANNNIAKANMIKRMSPSYNVDEYGVANFDPNFARAITPVTQPEPFAEQNKLIDWINKLAVSKEMKETILKSMLNDKEDKSTTVSSYDANGRLKGSRKADTTYNK